MCVKILRGGKTGNCYYIYTFWTWETEFYVVASQNQVLDEPFPSMQTAMEVLAETLLLKENDIRWTSAGSVDCEFNVIDLNLEDFKTVFCQASSHSEEELIARKKRRRVHRDFLDMEVNRERALYGFDGSVEDLTEDELLYFVDSFSFPYAHARALLVTLGDGRVDEESLNGYSDYSLETLLGLAEN